MLQGITFDYDGTLARTFERQYKWFRHWAHSNGKRFPFRNLRSFQAFYNQHCTLEKGVQQVYDELELPCDMNDRSHPVWNAYIEFGKQNPVDFYPGMKKTILELWELSHLSQNSLRNRRLRMSINTTNTWQTIYPELVREGVLQCFDCFVTSEVLKAYHGANGGNWIAKPAKISLALTLGLIDSEGESTLHIGDTVNDLAASHKVIRLNPMKPETLITVGCSWGYEGRQKLEQGYPLGDKGTIHFNHIIDSPHQLLPIVKDLMRE